MPRAVKHMVRIKIFRGIERMVCFFLWLKGYDLPCTTWPAKTYWPPQLFCGKWNSLALPYVCLHLQLLHPSLSLLKAPSLTSQPRWKSEAHFYFIYHLFIYYRLSFISLPHSSPLPLLSLSLREEETRSCVMKCPVRKKAEFSPSLTTTTKPSNRLPSSQGFTAFHPDLLRLLPCLVNCPPEGIGGEDVAPCSRQEEWSCPCGTHSQGEKNPLIFLLDKQKGCRWLLFLHASIVVCIFARGGKFDGMLSESFWKGGHKAGKSGASQWWAVTEKSMITTPDLLGGSHISLALKLIPDPCLHHLLQVEREKLQIHFTVSVILSNNEEHKWPTSSNNILHWKRKYSEVWIRCCFGLSAPLLLEGRLPL